MPLINLVLVALGAVEMDFNNGWQFSRGDSTSFHLSSADDSRTVDLPHDWAIEDLPSREDDTVTPVLAVRRGTWRFFAGEGNGSEAAPHFDDTNWTDILIPSDWRTTGYEATNASGWFRRNISVSAAAYAAATAGTLRLALGSIATADRTYINGVHVGSTGVFHRPNGCSSRLDYRSYHVPVSALHVGADNVIAVWVWSEGGPLNPSADRKFTFEVGPIAAGNDVLPPATMAVGAALTTCNVTRACVGVTFRANASAQPLAPSTIVKAYFKSVIDVNAADTSWQSYVVQPSMPGGLFDWAEEDARVGPFDPGASIGHKQTGYTLGGVGWYRKEFTPDLSSGHHLQLFIEGCYMNCSIFLNGDHLTTHPYGYTSFHVPLPAATLRHNQANTLAVRVESRGSNSRWYSGAGLFRPVSLLAHPPLHIVQPGGLYITTPNVTLTTADGTQADATVNVNITITNAGAALVPPGMTAAVTIIDVASGTALDSASAAFGAVSVGGTASLIVAFTLSHVRTWSPHQPSLYRAQVTISQSISVHTHGNAAMAAVVQGPHSPQPAQLDDTQSAVFGVRSFSFESTSGFVLNGQSVVLRGGCVHHDNGPLGSKAIARAEERRVERLKANGYNAIRTSHNPVSRAFVAACERLGMLLMEEAFDCWDQGKNNDDYHLFFDEWWQRDLASMVLRDRNSPAIVLWSIGNEIPNRHTPRGAYLSAALSKYVRFLDDAGGGSRRAITSAYPGVGTDNATNAYLAPLDVSGYNYSPYGFERDHITHPARVITATETFPMKSVANFDALTDYPWVVGTFIWTAIDYIGESAIGANGHAPPDPLACGSYCPLPWSYHISFCGDLDIVGGQKPQAFLRRALWNVSALEMAVKPADTGEVVAAWGFPDERQSWSWGTAQRPMHVNVYSTRVACVVLSVNGRNISDGCASISRATGHTFSAALAFEPGTLRAVGYSASGRFLGQRTLVTAGEATALRLVADRTRLATSRADLSYVTVEVVDAIGTLVTCANESRGAGCVPPTVRFILTGDGEIAAVGSGDPTDPSSFHKVDAGGALARKTYRGRATAILRPGSAGAQWLPRSGKLTLTATAAGLSSATITIELGDEAK